MGLSRKKLSVTVCPEMSSDSKLRYEVGNLQGIGARARQEDSFTLVNALDEQKSDALGLMFIVCDGMGGMKDGKLASETAIKSLRNSFSQMNRLERIGEQLKESAFSASDEVEKILEGDGGSTVVAGIIIHEKLYFASVGDSFMYLYRDGSLYRLNVEHNICYQRYLEDIKDGALDAKSCREDPEAAALTQFLGMPGLSEVDYSANPINLRKGDVLLACSDGVGGVVEESEIIEALQWFSVNDMCQRLEKHIISHANPNQDNYTALTIKCC